jgi:hypothetical protein
MAGAMVRYYSIELISLSRKSIMDANFEPSCNMLGHLILVQIINTGLP